MGRPYERESRSRREFLWLLASTPIALVTAACLGSDDPEVRVTVDGGNPPPRSSQSAPTGGAPTAVPFTPAAPPSDLEPADLHGFVMPIEGACYPGDDDLMPNASRESRNAIHGGVDFYWGDSCVLIERGTPVVAAYEGVVTRVDHDFVPITFDEVSKLNERVAADESPDEATLDRFLGRQVWIDHGNGVVTRYAHLSRVTADLVEGVRVPQGHRIGGVGESGSPDSITSPGSALHLHWEVRVGDSYLGAGEDPEAVRALYHRLLDPRSEG
ncbi:MAG: M23 family metallopeptidase [Chloroflexi bacterium]|nr:M23 family metallopeptidase [Chloroflexota bacterium]